MLWYCNTIDQARAFKNDLKAGQILMLDEFNPGGAQVDHCDANMMKVLLNPVAPGTVRARKDDVSLPAGLIRVLTANSESLDHWLEPLRADPADQAAIERRMATLHVTHSLWRTAGAGRPRVANGKGMRVKRTFENALESVQNVL